MRWADISNSVLREKRITQRDSLAEDVASQPYAITLVQVPAAQD